MTNLGKIKAKIQGLLFAWLLFALSAVAQSPECFFVHFDKSFYASGETIWFKAYRIGTANEVNSRILHIDLVSHQNKLIASQKLLIENGSGYGSITLPLNSEEGLYRFRAYTRYDLNYNPPLIYNASIPIYSPEYSENPNADNTSPGNSNPVGFSGISVASDNKIYKPRDSLTISFQVEGITDIDKANFSVSVVPSEIVSLNFEFYRNLQCPDLSPGPGSLMLPEKHLFVEGKLQDPVTGKNINSRLLSVYVNESSQLIRASSSEGRIKVAVPDYWGSGVFQILNLDPYNKSGLKLIEEPKGPGDPYNNPNPPHRTSKVLKYLDQLKKRRKVIELFDLYNVPEISTSTDVIRDPDAVYKTADFRQIYTFEQFINEAIQNVKVREIDNTKTVRLFNRDQGRLFEDHPWYLVDGFLTFNEAEVLQIPYQDIIEVRLFSKTSTLENYFQGFMFRSGVMEIITRDVKYVRELKNSPNTVEIEGFSTSENFSNTFTLPKDNTTPDLRGTMYWSPNLVTDEQGQGQITIPLSDDTGQFAVVIMGTNSMGRPVSGYCSFEVKIQ